METMLLSSQNEAEKNHILLSDKYNQGLLFCWKVRTGFRKQIEPERIKMYSDCFFQNYLSPHFNMEERFVFPLLGKQHELVKISLSKHRRLKKLFEEEVHIQKSLSLIEEELENHIRYEKRKLLIELQRVVSEKELDSVIRKYAEIPVYEMWIDEFWK